MPGSTPQFDPTGFLSGNAPRAENPEDFLDLSWEMFGELCRALALRVARDYDPDFVIGIARAGVIPGEG